MKNVLILVTLLVTFHSIAAGDPPPAIGTASWYGEAHRGKAMANGQPFDPDRLTAASWFYPLGTRVRVTLDSQPSRSVMVTITDRGPAHRLVREGRIIDLSRRAFEQLESADAGLIRITLKAVDAPP